MPVDDADISEWLLEKVSEIAIETDKGKRKRKKEAVPVEYISSYRQWKKAGGSMATSWRQQRSSAKAQKLYPYLDSKTKKKALAVCDHSPPGDRWNGDRLGEVGREHQSDSQSGNGKYQMFEETPLDMDRLVNDMLTATVGAYTPTPAPTGTPQPTQSPLVVEVQYPTELPQDTYSQVARLSYYWPPLGGSMRIMIYSQRRTGPAGYSG